MPDRDLYTTNSTNIVFYTKFWCPDCRRARAVLDRSNVHYQTVDVENDRQADFFIRQVNRGCCSVPTIIFPDGDILVEPTESELTEKLRHMAISGQ